MRKEYISKNLVVVGIIIFIAIIGVGCAFSKSKELHSVSVETERMEEFERPKTEDQDVDIVLLGQEPFEANKSSFKLLEYEVTGGIREREGVL